MPRFRATLTVDYDLTPSDLQDAYGTSDALDAAAIDESTLNDDPATILLFLDDKPAPNYTLKVEVIDQ